MRRIPFIVLMLTVCCSIWATSVSKEQARRQAELFLEQNSMSGVLTQAPTDEGKTRSAQTGEELYYVFNVGQNQGYVIVSGDDRTESILGYATSGTFDAATIPENMAAWLDGYAEQIRYIQEHNIQPAPFRLVKKAKATVNELITTKWGQDAPFSNYCPQFGSKHAPTGCSATALAQVMKFWEYPKTFSGTVPAYTSKTHNISMPSLPATTFDWDNMVDDYTSGTNDTQQEAVARLLRYVSSALESDFEANTTSALDIMYEKALNLFGYASSAKLMRRTSSISAEQWDNLIYHEISNGRPVVYNGQASNGGHAFVLHGYKNGYYAVNWGWNGYQDNYFRLDAMNPDGGGTGHYAGGYNSKQTAVIGISPSNVDTYTITEDPILHCYDIGVGNPSSTQYSWQRNASGNIDFAFRFVIGSELAYTYTFNLGFVVIKSGETSGQVIQTGNTNFNFGPASSSTVSGTRTFGSNLSDGEYYVLPTCKKIDDSQWRVCRNPNNIGILMTVTSSQISMKVGYVKSDPDPDPDPQPDPDPDPQPDPGSEVTQQDLDQLMASLSDVRTTLSKFAYDLSAISKAINDNFQAITARTNELTAIYEAMTAIEETLEQDKLLSDQQKQEFAATLEDLNETYIINANGLSDISELASAVNEFIPQIKEVDEQCKVLEATIPQITTKEELTAAQEQLDMLNSQLWSFEELQTGTDVAEIEQLAKSLATTTYADLKTAVDELSAKVKAATNAVLLSQANEELAKAVKQATDLVASYTEHYTKDKASIEEISAKLKELTDAIATMKKQTAEMEAKVKALEGDKNASAEDVATIKSSLDKTNKNIADIEGQIATIQGELATVITQTEELGKILTDGKKQADDAQAQAAKATEPDVVKKLTSDLTIANAVLEENAVNYINTLIDNFKLVTGNVNIVVNNVNGVKESVATIDLALDAAIKAADAQKEKDEQEKQKAEELAKAREEFTKAADNLAALISNMEASNKSIASPLTDLQQKLPEVLETINALKLEADKLGALEKALDAATSISAADIAKYKNSIAEVRERMSSMESTYAQLKEQADKQVAQAEQIAKLTADAIRQHEELLAKAAAAKDAAEVQKLTASANDEAAKLKGDADSQANALIKALVATLIDVNNLRESGTTVKTSIEKVSQEIEAAIAQDTEAKQKAEELAKANEGFTKAIKALTDLIAATQKSYDEGITKFNELKKSLAEAEEAVATMKQQLAGLEKMVAELEEKAGTTRAATAEDIAKYKEAIVKLSTDITAMETQIAQLKEQLNAVAAQNDALANTLTDAQKLADDLQAKAKTQTDAAEVEKLTAQIADQKAKLTEAATKANLDENLAAIAESVKTAQQTITTASVSITELEQTVDNAITAVNAILLDELQVVSRHDMKGNPVDATYRGVQIIRLKNGKIFKQVVK